MKPRGGGHQARSHERTLARTSGLPFGFVITQCGVVAIFIFQAITKQGAGRWIAMIGIVACLVSITLRVRTWRRDQRA